MPPFPRSVELKLARASEQVRVLDEAVTSWAVANPLVATCKLREGRLGFRVTQQEFLQPAPLENWGLLAGECIHNLRSALDNLAFALARLNRDPPERPKGIAFPIYTEKVLFEKNGRKNIDQLPQAAACLVQKLQPFQRDGSAALGTPERDALVLLQWLSNNDKHQIPSVVLIAPTEISHSFSATFQSEDDAAANVPPDTTIWAGPLRAGAVLLEYRTKHPLASAGGRFEGKAIVALQINSEPQAIVPVLQALTQYVGLVCAQFAPFFAPLQRCVLTLPSRGRAPASRVTPLMSNVRATLRVTPTAPRLARVVPDAKRVPNQRLHRETVCGRISLWENCADVFIGTFVFSAHITPKHRYFRLMSSGHSSGFG